jgi:hypothetical protein
MGLIWTSGLLCWLRFAQAVANLLAQRDLARRAAAARQPSLQEIDADLVDGRRLPNLYLQRHRFERGLTAPLTAAELTQGHAAGLVERGSIDLDEVLDTVEVAQPDDTLARLGHGGMISSYSLFVRYGWLLWKGVK